MKCYECGADTRVLRTQADDNGFETVRQRRCDGPAEHKFETRERRAGNARIDQVLVRHSGDRKLAGPFDRERLTRDIQNGVLRIGDQEVHEVVEDAIRQLEISLHDLAEPLTVVEVAEHPGYTGSLIDSVITDAVEKQLRRRQLRMAHVLYAISIRGRRDREGRRGWDDARDVLEWLGQNDNYPRLKVSSMPPPRPSSPITWYPTFKSPRPAFVIKKERPAESGGPALYGPHRQAFDDARFLGGISKALLGRPNADVHKYFVAEWVLWNLAGQSEVHSMQLASGVCDCLRRLDDIAYLRWASIFKGINQVTQFKEEALALLTDPSPRLQFDAAAAKSPTPTLLPPTRPGPVRFTPGGA